MTPAANSQPAALDLPPDHGCLTQIFEKSPARHPPAPQPDGIPWERGRPARIRNLPMLPPPPPDPGVNHKHPSRLIEVGETGEAVPGLVRAGRPRSQEVVIPYPSPSAGIAGGPVIK